VTSPAQMTERQIADEIASYERAYGHRFAHAAEYALNPGDTIFGLSADPCTVVSVRGRRFIEVTSPTRPVAHYIDWSVFALPDGTRLVDHIIRFEKE
jgi:hypothetical protein